MNKQEALETLERLFSDSTNEDYPFTECFANALAVAMQALEKQIPKKPRKTDSYRGILRRIYAYVCPNCGNACLEKQANERQDTMFCWNCGQKLDWGGRR